MRLLSMGYLLLLRQTAVAAIERDLLRLKHDQFRIVHHAENTDELSSASNRTHPRSPYFVKREARGRRYVHKDQ